MRGVKIFSVVLLLLFAISCGNINNRICDIVSFDAILQNSKHDAPSIVLLSQSSIQ